MDDIQTNEELAGIQNSGTSLQSQYTSLNQDSRLPNVSELKVNNVSSNTTQSGQYAPLHPSTRSWEVPRQHVTLEKIIGKGAFGQVAKGTVRSLRGRPGKTLVAIKKLRGVKCFTNIDKIEQNMLRSFYSSISCLRPRHHAKEFVLLLCHSNRDGLCDIIVFLLISISFNFVFQID